MAAKTERGVPLSALSPKFLHTNSTSHTWPFSAIAELIDNAYDPDANAKQFWIDKTCIKGHDCLTFVDNGAGMNYDKMYKMLSFGFSDKQTINGHIPVGLYGNGFKSGSMRLGKDAIVFSKSKDSMNVGLLSQSYLEEIKAQNVVVPIVTFRHTGQNRVAPEHVASLKDILRYSLFNTESELLSELQAINATSSSASTGTRIIIWNLRRMANGQPEFDFNIDKYDIQIPADVYETTSEKYKRQDRPTQSVPESDYSLRAYCSILYLKPRMHVVIRGQKVKTQLISKSLAFIAKDHYRPIFLSKRIPITFGYNTKSKDQYGIMMYHKNRLIKGYERVGCQLKANNKGVGVIGVIECNFLKPTHNKQDFDYTDEYRKTINNLGIKLEEYWNEIRFKQHNEDPNCEIPVEDTKKRPDQNWVQCDDCLKWRKLPDGIDCDLLPDKWFCHMNPDPQFRSCHVEEEPEDSDDDQPSYQKTYKQQEKYNKIQQGKSRLEMEQAKKAAEMQRIAALAQQNEALRRQHEDLKRQLKQSNFQATASTSTATDTPLVSCPARRGSLNSPQLSRTGHSPTPNNMPIISNVCSLSTPARVKRTLAINPDSVEVKRAKNGLHNNAVDIIASTKACPSSPVVIPSDEDDDILIIESSSTPKPKAAFDLAKVKTEQLVSEDATGMHLECSEDAAVEAPMEASATTSAMSPPSPMHISSTTQTDCRRIVKEEKEEGGENGESTGGKHSVIQQDQDRTEEQPTAAEREAVKEEGTEHMDERKNDEEAATLDKGQLHPENRNEEVAIDMEVKDVGSTVMTADLKERLLLEAQQQQDKLMEMMQSAAHERDAYKEQVHQLTCKVEDLEGQLLELRQTMVKKELSDQSTETEWQDEGPPGCGVEDVRELRALYQQAKQEVEELKQEHQTWGAAPQGRASSCLRDEEEEEKVYDEDELALQVDSLFRDLDRSNKEIEELKAKLQSMETEKHDLSSQCEKLKEELELLRVERADVASAREEGTQHSAENSGSTGNTGNVSHAPDEARRKLNELRRSVGRLLVTFVPALELEQVNYDCEVIDEILDQVIEEVNMTGDA
ncbi:MORC family CW-type zinc finger protein 3a [Scleropages formosus]|uniref:MORC family CW-type zinc finger 3a n=1 Tax=Scleropages formosus TaxID=113540 RepID=A0A8C9V3B5_SCLFO|nr:MORC family CW-type zinc finger protein 3 [Scleropages formosus]